jgi:hypothetical protein
MVDFIHHNALNLAKWNNYPVLSEHSTLFGWYTTKYLLKLFRKVEATD